MFARVRTKQIIKKKICPVELKFNFYSCVCVVLLISTFVFCLFYILCCILPNRPMVWLVKQNTWPDPFRVLLPINPCSSKRTPIKKNLWCRIKIKSNEEKNLFISHSTPFITDFSFCTSFCFKKKIVLLQIRKLELHTSMVKMVIM